MLSRSKAELFKCSADALGKRGGAHLQEPTVGFRPWEGVGQEVNLHALRLTLDAPMAITHTACSSLHLQNLSGTGLRAGH